jgi:hypothetical protein
MVTILIYNIGVGMSKTIPNNGKELKNMVKYMFEGG